MMAKYVCSMCGFTYDEEKGLPEKGIKPGTKWEEIKDTFYCPLCGASSDSFIKEE